MPPNQSNEEFSEQSNKSLEKLVPGRITPRKYVINYPHVALFGYGNAAACYGLYLAITKATWNTIIFNPHNASRGFFFSHIGWLLVKEHEEVEKRIKHVDMTDILSNPVLKFQYDYAEPFIIIISLLPPTIIPVYFWGESLNIAWHLAVLRCTINQHMTFLINSAAHIWGNKPYDRSIKPTQNLSVSVASFGEGFHNYHHTFPWDYRAAELGNNWLNMTTLFIDFFEWIGWAYDLKTVDKNIVRNRAKRTGDESDLWGLKKTFKKDNFKQKIFE
ncbi:unnamed protein product [Leptidea sinapis]|uniref:Fatty acid desaturase domain-containing protein n=1 Tax=Leptidea sinapis TaxID=189913 RepID=A0A5E4R0P6_9NEOP|nr:unnamed protein product [Leptidea sinapis]